MIWKDGIFAPVFTNAEIINHLAYRLFKNLMFLFIGVELYVCRSEMIDHLSEGWAFLVDKVFMYQIS